MIGSSVSMKPGVKLGQMEMREKKGEHGEPKGLMCGRAGETWESGRLSVNDGGRN